jgi:hypothetical protein
MSQLYSVQYKRLKLLRASIAKTQRLDQAVERIFNVGEFALPLSRILGSVLSTISSSHPPFSTRLFHCRWHYCTCGGRYVSSNSGHLENEHAHSLNLPASLHAAFFSVARSVAHRNRPNGKQKFIRRKHHVL